MPNSTFLPAIFEHKKEPMAMPIENIAINNVANNGEPLNTFFAKFVNCVKNVAPKNQNHEIPIAVRKMA